MNPESPILPADIPSEGLKPDWDLLDRYQTFSAELLRMSLAGIAGIGFLVIGKAGLIRISGLPRLSMIVALVTLGLSAGAALTHRYVSSDSMACHVRLLRMELRGTQGAGVASEKAARNFRLKLSSVTLFVSALFLGIGASALAVSFILLLTRS
jgi:hypothetical protein